MTQDEILQKLDADIRLRGLSNDTVKEYHTKACVFMRHLANLQIRWVKPSSANFCNTFKMNPIEYIVYPEN